jgi:type IV secretion system protein VirB9
MKLRRALILILCGSVPAFGAGAKAAAKKDTAPKPPQAVEAKKNPPPEKAAPLAAKVIDYSERDVARIYCKIRFTTLVILPKYEKILDYTCGDKDFWVIDGNQNFALVKPAKAGATTNVNLLTASGNTYSFLFVEVSEMPNAEPDLKVFVQAKDESAIAAAGGSPRFVSVKDLETMQQQLAAAREETRQAKQTSQSDIDKGISRFISNVRFAYRFEAGKKPFHVRSMYHDDKFTFIQARPEEAFTLYEIKDGGKPSLVNFDYKDSVYIVDKILDRGYLVIGKQKLAFVREE